MIGDQARSDRRWGTRRLPRQAKAMLGRFNSFGNWKMKTHFLSARDMTSVSEGVVNSCLAYADRYYEANGTARCWLGILR